VESAYAFRDATYLIAQGRFYDGLHDFRELKNEDTILGTMALAMVIIWLSFGGRGELVRRVICGIVNWVFFADEVAEPLGRFLDGIPDKLLIALCSK